MYDTCMCNGVTVMAKSGLGLLLTLALASVANAAASIDLVPDNTGPYNGGETVMVDVMLNQATEGATNHLLRLVQLDFTDSSAQLAPSLVWDFSSAPDCTADPAPCIARHFLEDLTGPRGRVVAAAFHNCVSAADCVLGPDSNRQWTLKADGSAVKVAELLIVLPTDPGDYLLDVLNTDEADPNKGGQVSWGFGTKGNEPVTYWRANEGNVSGGTYTFTVVPSDTQLVSSTPADQERLTHSANNAVFVEFDDDIAAPGSGQVLVREIQDGCTLGADLSSSFTMTVENNGGGQLRVLKLVENGQVLEHRKWYSISNTGGWGGVADFEVQLLLQIGDANNDGTVTFADLARINGDCCGPADPADDRARSDINGDGNVTFADMSVANGNIPSAGVPNPCVGP